MTMTPQRAILSVFIANVLFGLLSPVSKFVMEQGVMDGVTLASLRLCGAALLFYILSFFCPKQPVDKRDLIPLFLMSLCGMALNQYLFIIGVSYTVPSNAALAATTTPVVTVILARILLKQKISLPRALGIALALSGVLMLVIGSSTNQGREGHPLGDFMCMCSQLLSSCYFLFFIRLIRFYHPVVLMKWLFGLSALISLPFVGGHLIEFPWAELSSTSILGSCYVVVGSTFLSYLLLLPGQKYLPVAAVVVFIYMQPVIAMGASMMWDLEDFSLSKACAALLIGVGVWLVQRYQSTASNPQNKEVK